MDAEGDREPGAVEVEDVERLRRALAEAWISVDRLDELEAELERLGRA